MSCQAEILICLLLTGLSLLQIPSSEGAIGPGQAYQNNATAFQFVRTIFDELLSLTHHDSGDSKSHLPAKDIPDRHKSQNEIQCVENQKADVGTKAENHVIHKTDKHSIEKKQLKSFWDEKQDYPFDNLSNGTKHKITKRQAAVYFQQRTDEELDYRDHWQLGLKKAFFNTLTYVEKRIQDDEKRYKLWMKIKRSRFLKRKLLMSTDGAEHNKFGVIINRNVKFEIRQTDSAIYECISKTCKPDHDVTAVWKIRTIDSDTIERDPVSWDSTQNDEYYATGTRQRHLRYPAHKNKRLDRTRRHAINHFPVNSKSKIRIKRDIHEKIEDDFNIEEKLKLDNDLDNEEVTRYKRNRSFFQQNNRNVRINNNEQSQTQSSPYQSTQRLYPIYESIPPSPTTLVLNDDPWKPIVTTQYYSPDLMNKDSFTRYIQDESLEYLSAKEKYKIPLDSFDQPRAYSDLNSQKILESWKSQPIILTNPYKTPKVVQLLPTVSLPKNSLRFSPQTFPKQFDISGVPLEVSKNSNNLNNQQNVMFDEQEHHKINQQQVHSLKKQSQQQENEQQQIQYHQLQQQQQQQQESQYQQNQQQPTQFQQSQQQPKQYQQNQQQPKQFQQSQQQPKQFQQNQQQPKQFQQNQQQPEQFQQNQQQPKQFQQNQQQPKQFQQNQQQPKQFQQSQQQQKQFQQNQQQPKQYQQNQQQSKQYQQNQQRPKQYQQQTKQYQQNQQQFQQNQQQPKQNQQIQQQPKQEIQQQQNQQQSQQQFVTINKAQFVKNPLLPTRIPESALQISQEDFTLDLNNNNENIEVKNPPGNNLPHELEKIQDPLNKPWMSLRINSSPNQKTMIGENNANYAKIQTYPPRSNIESVGIQNVPTNKKNFKPRFIDDTDINLSNIPSSRFKPTQDPYQTKNLPYDIKIPQVPLTGIKTGNHIRDKEIISVPESDKIPFQNLEYDLLPKFKEESLEQPTTKIDPIEYSTETEPTIWAKIPPVPETVGQIISNQLKYNDLNTHHEPTRSRNIDSNVNFHQNFKEINHEENVKNSEQTDVNNFDEIKSIVPLNEGAYKFGNDGVIGIIDQNEQTTESTTKTEVLKNHTVTNQDLHDIKDLASHTQDDTAGEVEDDDYEGEYDEYQEDDYEDTDEEPQIIKTSIQHCKALAKNTLILSRNKNLNFIIKPMLIFFKTNFDNFVKEHCYLYTTEKDLKILNNDLNLELEERKNKRILRSNKNGSKSHKRNLKKKYKHKNYKIYRNYEHDDGSVEDSGHDSYRDSFETYGKKRSNVLNSYSKKSDDTENQKGIGNLDSSEVTHRQIFIPGINTDKVVTNDKEIVTDKKDIERIHHLFKNNEDHISALKLDSVNFSDDIQGIRRIDDGPYSIIIYPKVLLTENDELHGIIKNSKKKMQSRRDDDTDVEYLDDANISSLKNNKKFRFPTVETFVPQDSISTEYYPKNSYRKDGIAPVIEKFTLGDLPSLKEDQKTLYSGTRIEQSTDRSKSSSIKFPHIENFFTNNQNYTKRYTEYSIIPTTITPSNNKKDSVIDKNDNFNVISKDKYFKPKGQVIDEIIYIPNHPLHELFDSKFPQPISENNVDKKHLNFKVTAPQTLSVIPSFEDNKNIVVSSQILVGKHADNMNSKQFARTNTDSNTHYDEKQETEISSEDATLINRRHDDMDFITTEDSKSKHEFGPILKDGFLPILPILMEKSSQSENVHTIVTPTTQSVAELKNSPQILIKENLKTNNADFNPLRSPQVIKNVTNFIEPLKTSFFKTESPVLSSSMINVSRNRPSTHIHQKNITRNTNNKFKPSLTFTMYSEPDPSYLQSNDMIISRKSNVETQTEDGQFIYTTESTILNTSRTNIIKPLHDIDVIKIVENKFPHIQSNSESNVKLLLNASEKEHVDNKDEIEEATIYFNSNDSKFSLLMNTTKTSGFRNGDELLELGNEKTLDTSTVSFSTEKNNFLANTKNETLNNEGGKVNSNDSSYLMQLFPGDEERDKKTERYSAEISNKTSTEIEKETIVPNQNISTEHSSAIEPEKTNVYWQEITNHTSGDKSKSPNDILIKNIKNQREKLFLEKNIMNYDQKHKIQEDTFRIVKSYSESSSNNSKGPSREIIASTDSPLFLYKTVTSIIEKDPLSTIEYSGNNESSNYMITTAFPTTTHHTVTKEQHDYDFSEPLLERTTTISSTKINEKVVIKKEKELDDLKEYSSMRNRSNSKATLIGGKIKEIALDVNFPATFDRKENYSSVNSELTKSNETRDFEFDDSTLPNDIKEKTEILSRNIIEESLRSYKSDNSTKTPLRKYGLVKAKNESHSINNQYLKATTFHPIHFKTTTAQSNTPDTL